MLKTTILAISLLVIPASSFAQAEDSGVRSSVQRFYSEWTAAVKKSDWKALGNLMTDDYEVVDTQGRHLTRSQMLGMANGHAVKIDACSIKVDQVQVQSGNEASTWITWTTTYRIKTGPKWQAMTATRKLADTLVKSGDGWKVKFSQQLPTDEKWGSGT